MKKLIMMIIHGVWREPQAYDEPEGGHPRRSSHFEHVNGCQSWIQKWQRVYF